MTPIERVGIGYDSHRTAPDLPLVLGGLRIESDFGLAGHSDADVVLHAVTDALLGAAGLPDIGELFPDTDPRFKDADSRELLAEVLSRLNSLGWTPVNVDLIVHAERPKLSAHKERIRESLRELLGIDRLAISVKAKTNEGLGPVGEGQAIACTAIVGLSGTS